MIIYYDTQGSIVFLGGHHNSVDFIGRKTWGSMGPWIPPGCRDDKMSLVVAAVRGATTRTGSAAPFALEGIGLYAFHG